MTLGATVVYLIRSVHEEVTIPEEIRRYHPRRSELFSPNKIKFLTLFPPFLTNKDPNQTENRLNVMSSGLFLLNVPKEIYFELLLL